MDIRRGDRLSCSPGGDGMTLIRVFPRRTKWTPTDSYAFVGDPPMMRPEADEVHVSCVFTWGHIYWSAMGRLSLSGRSMPDSCWRRRKGRNHETAVVLRGVCPGGLALASPGVVSGAAGQRQDAEVFGAAQLPGLQERQVGSGWNSTPWHLTLSSRRTIFAGNMAGPFGD